MLAGRKQNFKQKFMNQNKQKILDFIKEHKLAVVSSVKEDQPQAAVVGFSENDQFQLFIGTDKTSRKARNISTNPNIALVIGWDHGATVQIEGVAKEVDIKDRKEVEQNHIAKNPMSVKYAGDTNQTYIAITPKWARYTDLKKDPNEIIEVTFDYKALL